MSVPRWRSAGSVFGNPEGLSAGRLLDAAGCRGQRIGGAWVCGEHANVIETDDMATTSDVRALMRWMARKAETTSGVALVREVRVLW